MQCAVLCSVLLLSLLRTTCGNEACSGSKPNFKAPERRISEEKCREYNWEKKCSSQDTAINKYPYMGAVAYKRDNDVKYMCNAFLISPKFAVTAAHCARTVGGSQGLTPEFVRFGNNNLKDVPVTDAKVVRIILHPEFAVPKRSFDIALLEFEQSLPVSRAVAPACLWTQPEITTNQDILLSAWAVTDEDKNIDVLRTMTIQAIDSNTCEPLIKNHYNRRFVKLADHQLCVNESDTKNYFHQGSSGAPFVISVPLGNGDEMPYVQASSSFGFTKSVRIGIFIKISNFVDWIEKTVWPEV